MIALANAPASKLIHGLDILARVTITIPTFDVPSCFTISQLENFPSPMSSDET
jgi:hypothetical protein